MQHRDAYVASRRFPGLVVSNIACRWHARLQWSNTVALEIVWLWKWKNAVSSIDQNHRSLSIQQQILRISFATGCVIGRLTICVLLTYGREERRSTYGCSNSSQQDCTMGRQVEWQESKEKSPRWIARNHRWKYQDQRRRMRMILLEIDTLRSEVNFIFFDTEKALVEKMFEQHLTPLYRPLEFEVVRHGNNCLVPVRDPDWSRLTMVHYE